MLQRVERGELDAALISEPNHVPADLVWRQVATEKIVVAAPPQSAEKTDRELLAAWPYIRYNRRAWVARPIQQSLRARAIRPRQAMELDSIDSILLMVYSGLGVAIVPERCVEGPFPLPVRYVPFGEPPLERRIGLIERADNPKSSLAQALHAAFASHVAAG